MPRPRKLRTVCCLPDTDAFGPTNQNRSSDNTIIMTIDEYEAIRLIDLESFTQEECATQMNIARTTVQSIYAEARKKIAEAIVGRKWLIIAGGDVVICTGSNQYCGHKGCQRHGHCNNALPE